jgi:hypothetical protein
MLQLAISWLIIGNWIISNKTTLLYTAFGRYGSDGIHSLLVSAHILIVAIFYNHLSLLFKKEVKDRKLEKVMQPRDTSIFSAVVTELMTRS